MGIAQMILIFGSGYQALLNFPAVALENAMACRVYRAAALGFITDGAEGTAVAGIFTTVLSESVSIDVVLDKECRLDMKGE